MVIYISFYSYNVVDIFYLPLLPIILFIICKFNKLRLITIVKSKQRLNTYSY